MIGEKVLADRCFSLNAHLDISGKVFTRTARRTCLGITLATPK